jgi:hypothetical protein
LVWMVNNNILINMTVTNTDCLPNINNKTLFTKEYLLCVFLLLTVYLYNNPPIIVPSCQYQVRKDIQSLCPPLLYMSKYLHRLFTLPCRITTNNNKDIVVVDRTSRDTGRVVVVGCEEGLRWTYTGHSTKEYLLCVFLLLTVCLYNNPPIIVPSCQCQVRKDI